MTCREYKTNLLASMHERNPGFNTCIGILPSLVSTQGATTSLGMLIRSYMASLAGSIDRHQGSRSRNCLISGKSWILGLKFASRLDTGQVGEAILSFFNHSTCRWTAQYSCSARTQRADFHQPFWPADPPYRFLRDRLLCRNTRWHNYTSTIGRTLWTDQCKIHLCMQIQ